MFILIDFNDIERGTQSIPIWEFIELTKIILGLIDSGHTFEVPKKYEKLQLRTSIARKGKKRGKEVILYIVNNVAKEKAIRYKCYPSS